MHANRFPARLHVLMARDAARAIILRRGPSKLVRVILWHTDRDTFEGGQWLAGRIYEERCDLSPDGKLMVYFAAAQPRDPEGGYRGTWTAISKPPYLTALGLWPIGHTWCGGGVFLADRVVYLYLCGDEDPHPDHQPPKKQLRIFSKPSDLNGTNRARLDRYRGLGWQQVYAPAKQPNMYGLRVDDPPIWHNPHPKHAHIYLARRYYGYIPDHYPGPAIVEYALGDRQAQTETPLERVTWAGWDQRGRLAYARDGQLFAHPVAQLGSFVRPLADFNDQTFEAIATPAWARRW